MPSLAADAVAVFLVHKDVGGQEGVVIVDLLCQLADIVHRALVAGVIAGEVAAVAGLVALKVVGQVMLENDRRAVFGDLGVEMADGLPGVVLRSLEEVGQGAGV